jgi:hypothetical protein
MRRIPESSHGISINLQDLADIGSYFIQLAPFGQNMIAGREPKAKAIPSKPRDDMQVNVKNLLTCRLTICQE